MPNERKTFDIHISNELREILNVIKTESLVASLLLRTTQDVDQLVESPMNYISISSTDRTKLSYLSEDRLSSIPTSEYWTSSRRYFAKPGAFVTKVFKDIPAKEIEIFSNLFRTHSKKREFDLQVVKGEKIKEYYFYESYNSDGRGSLGVSCMKHQHCQKYFDLYTDNEDNVSMLVMLNDKGKLIGRALLWDFDSNKIMDRIYTQNDEELSFHFKQWATDNGYFYKSEQNWYNSLYFEQLGVEKQELHLKMKLPKGRQHFYPYMDTFKFIDLKTDEISNYIPEDTTNLKVLCSSEGGKNNHDYLVLDGIDRVFRYRNDAAFLDYINMWTGRQNVIYSNYNDKYILNKDSYYEELIGDYIFNEENFDKNSKRVFELIERKKKEKEEYAKRNKSTESKKKIQSDDYSSAFDAMRNMYDMYGINRSAPGLGSFGSFRTWMDTPRRRREGVRDDSREALGANEGRAESLDGNLDVRVEDTIRLTRPVTENTDSLTGNGTVIVDTLGSTITTQNLRYSINPRSGEIDVRPATDTASDRVEIERRNIEESTARLERIQRDIWQEPLSDINFDDDDFLEDL